MSQRLPHSQADSDAAPAFPGADLLAGTTMQTLAERASVGIYVACGFRILYANSYLCEMMGYSRDALLAMEDTPAALLAPDEQDRIRAYGRARMRGDPAPSVYATRIVRADGAELPVELDISTFEVDGIVLSQGTVVDISEHLRIERALRAQEAALRALLDASTESAALMDAEGRVLAANAVFAHRLGHSLDQIIGRSVEIDFPPPVRAQRVAARERVLRSRKAMRFIDTRGPYTFDVHIYPVFDPSGTVTRLAIFARNISEQRDAERASEEARQELVRRNRDLVILNRIALILARSLDLEAALGTVIDHVIERDGVDAASLVLPEGISGAPLVVSRGAGLLVPPFGLQGEPCFLLDVGAARAELASTGRSISFHELDDLSSPFAAELERAGYAHLACVPVPIAGEVGGALVLLARARLQISEGTLHTLGAFVAQVGWAVENARLAVLASQVQVREELSALQARFLADVSHEFRTPLGLIRSASQSLRSADVDFPPQVRDELLRIIEDETGRLEEQVENLLLVARTDGQPPELHRRSVDLAELARTAIARIAPLSAVASGSTGRSETPGTSTPAGDRPTFQFAVRAPDDPVLAWADPTAMGHVLGNLLSNAIKYSPHGGTVTVDVAAQDGDALVRVHDQGIGIAPDHLERIFERFHRAPNALAIHRAGVGLGLSVCRTLVEAHGGRIWADSRLGQGSTLAFTIPLAGDEDHAKVSRPGPSTPWLD